MREDGVGAGSEDVGQVVAALGVHRDAEQPETGPPRLLDRHARVLDGVAALVVVDVVGLAVGQQQQQPVRVRTLVQQRRRVADSRAHAGVAAGLQRLDAADHARVQPLLEILDRPDVRRAGAGGR